MKHFWQWTIIAAMGGTLSQMAHSQSLALKNFRQIMASYEAITGIDSSNPNVTSAYRRVINRLPLRGEVGEVASPLILALTELGGVFCDEMIKEEVSMPSQARRFHKMISFSSNARQLTPSVISELLASYAERFWQRPITSQEEAVMTMQVDRLKTDRTGLRHILQLTCGNFASSVDYMLY